MVEPNKVYQCPLCGEIWGNYENAKNCCEV